MLDCSVHVRHINDKQVCRIDLSGSLAILPSTSNSRMIALNSRTGGRFIKKNYEHQKKLEMLTHAYAVACMHQGIMVPSFLKDPVYVLVLLAHNPRRHDSHNYAKPVGDWLQSIGLIKDDSLAEIDCRKKKDYFTNTLDQTEIIIIDKELIRNDTLEWIKKIRNLTQIKN